MFNNLIQIKVMELAVLLAFVPKGNNPFYCQEDSPMQDARKNTQHRFIGAAVGSVLAGAIFALAANPSYAITTVHQARAYGARVNVGSVVKLGPVAVSELPSCDTQNVGSFTASAAAVNQAGLVGTGLVSTSASSTQGSSTGSSETVGVNLLNGLITSTDIKAVSTSSVNGGVYSFSTAGSTFGSLKVLGIAIAANVAPNTVIELPLLGSVTLNEQVPYQSGDMASLTVNMIHVTLTLGANKGTEIIIGNASSSIKGQAVPAVVGGYAYAPQLVAKPVTTGPLALEIIPCFGTKGAVETDSVAATSIPGLLSTGAVTVTGTGNINKTETSSEATSTISGVNLLAGLVSATAIQGVASGVTADGTTFDFTGGSTFAGLSVAGHPEITVNVKPNTKIAIAGLGTLYLNKINYFPDKIKVAPIDLIINTTNTLGLPIGAELTVGVVEAALYSSTIP